MDTLKSSKILKLKKEIQISLLKNMADPELKALWMSL